jgi:hypothetical protein
LKNGKLRLGFPLREASFAVERPKSHAFNRYHSGKPLATITA